MVSPGAGLVGYLSLSAVFGILTETRGHAGSQFEERNYQFDVNRSLDATRPMRRFWADHPGIQVQGSF